MTHPGDALNHSWCPVKCRQTSGRGPERAGRGEEGRGEGGGGAASELHLPRPSGRPHHLDLPPHILTQETGQRHHSPFRAEVEDVPRSLTHQGPRHPCMAPEGPDTGRGRGRLPPSCWQALPHRLPGDYSKNQRHKTHCASPSGHGQPLTSSPPEASLQAPGPASRDACSPSPRLCSGSAVTTQCPRPCPPPKSHLPSGWFSAPPGEGDRAPSTGSSGLGPLTGEEPWLRGPCDRRGDESTLTKSGPCRESPGAARPESMLAPDPAGPASVPAGMMPIRSGLGTSAARGWFWSTPASLCVLPTRPCRTSLNMPSPPTQTMLRRNTAVRPRRPPPARSEAHRGLRPRGPGSRAPSPQPHPSASPPFLHQISLEPGLCPSPAETALPTPATAASQAPRGCRFWPRPTM